MNFSHLSHKTALCATMLSLSFGLSPVWAQAPATATEAAPTQSAPAEMTHRKFTLRNIKPSVVADWLDAANHESTPQLSLSQSSDSPILSLSSLARLPGNGRGPLGLKLPAGVETVTPIDSQNSLAAYGTKEGLDALEALLPTIDVSLVQYQIATHFIQLDRSALTKMGLSFPQSPNGTYNFGSIISIPDNSELLAHLDGPERSKEVKVLTAPRVTVIDGLEATMRQSTINPFIVDDQLAYEKKTTPPPALAPAVPNQHSSGLSAPIAQPGIAMMTSTIGIRTALLRRPNNLITLGITPTFGTRTLTVETTIHEDQPIAIQMSPSQDAQQLIVIVKTTRVRRVGEN